MDEDTKAIEWQEPEQAEEVPAPDPVAWNIEEPEPRGPDRSLMPMDTPGTPHLAVPEMDRIQPQEPPKPIFGEGGWGNVDIDPDNPLPKDEPERDRGAELRRRQESRIQIHQAEKAGNAEQADILRGIEARARKGVTTVFPDEMRDASPAPFTWHGTGGSDRSADFTVEAPVDFQPAQPRSPEEVAQLQSVAWQQPAQPESGGDTPQMPVPNPFENSTSEQITLLRLIADTLKSIDGKLPQQSTFS